MCVEDVDLDGREKIMIRSINLLKITYISGYLAKQGLINRPLSVELNAKSGDGKSYLLKRFSECNKGILLISTEDYTPNQFRERICDLKPFYQVMFDDIRFRDNKSRAIILSQITSVADMEFKFKQEAGDTEEQIKTSVIFCFNKDQHGSMLKVKKTLGLTGRLFSHSWKIDQLMYKDILTLNIPKDEDMIVNLYEIDYSPLCPPIEFNRFQTDFRKMEQVNLLYSIAKTINLSDEYIMELLEKNISWNVNHWKKEE